MAQKSTQILESSNFFPKQWNIIQFFLVLLKFSKALTGSSREQEFNEICAKNGVNYAYSAKWNGDDWIILMIHSLFILQDFSRGNASHQPHIDCWKEHVEYLRILLQESITDEEQQQCLTKCKAWRKHYESLYGKQECNIPNFHAVLHTICDIPNFGPPIGIWTRPFEHNHRWYRNVIDNGDKKNVEYACMQRLEAIRITELMFPFVKLEKSTKLGSYPVLRAGNYVGLKTKSGLERVAQVTRADSLGVDLKIFSLNCEKHPFIPESPKISSLKEEQTLMKVPYDKIKKKFLKSFYRNEEYLNPFGVLNFGKFKIPKRETEMEIEEEN